MEIVLLRITFPLPLSTPSSSPPPPPALFLFPSADVLPGHIALSKPAATFLGAEWSDWVDITVQGERLKRSNETL